MGFYCTTQSSVQITDYKSLGTELSCPNNMSLQSVLAPIVLNDSTAVVLRAKFTMAVLDEIAHQSHKCTSFPPSMDAATPSRDPITSEKSRLFSSAVGFSAIVTGH